MARGMDTNHRNMAAAAITTTETVIMTRAMITEAVAVMITDRMAATITAVEAVISVRILSVKFTIPVIKRTSLISHLPFPGNFQNRGNGSGYNNYDNRRQGGYDRPRDYRDREFNRDRDMNRDREITRDRDIPRDREITRDRDFNRDREINRDDDRDIDRDRDIERDRGNDRDRDNDRDGDRDSDRVSTSNPLSVPMNRN